LIAGNRTIDHQLETIDFPGSDNQRPSPAQTGLPSGGQSVVEPPGPIPNPEVKRRSADGIGTTGPVRVGRRQVFARPRVTSGPGAFLYP
jgi:hypothetical protein